MVNMVRTYTCRFTRTVKVTFDVVNSTEGEEMDVFASASGIFWGACMFTLVCICMYVYIYVCIYIFQYSDTRPALSFSL